MCGIVSVQAAEAGPCLAHVARAVWQHSVSSGVVAAAAEDGSSWAEPAGGDQSGGRACVRAGAQTWRAHLRGRQRGRSERASEQRKRPFGYAHDTRGEGAAPRQ